MRKIILGLVLLAPLASGLGCNPVPIYSADPIRRVRQLLISSEDLRMTEDEWERAWFLDQPDHMTPYRTDGGIVGHQF